jgi:hypothetical protein
MVWVCTRAAASSIRNRLRSTTEVPLPRTAPDTLVPQSAGIGGVVMGQPGVRLISVKFLTMATSPLSSEIFEPPGSATAGY